MNYCARCILPDSRPDIRLDAAGVCSACRAQESKISTDWGRRREAFRELVREVRSLGRDYDCVVPVSGGKDSTWQIVTCLEHGLKVLAVTWKTPARTEVGARNLANLVSLGVDHLDFQVNPKVERTFLYEALVRAGSTAIAMHLALFNIPLTVAMRFRIPLVVWGENTATEYGVDPWDARDRRLDAEWIRRFGACQGTTAADWISEKLTRRDLAPYFGPDAAELGGAGIQAVFLGSFFPWDPQNSLEVATAHGFRRRPEGPLTGYYDFADIDDGFLSIHHWLKWYKFGITRSFDNLSSENRNGRMTRADAIRWLIARGDETPHADIEAFCGFVGISRAHFFEVIEKFRNRDLWVRRGDRWEIRDYLIPDWPWI
jgi:N-acetyl sugar amidotransferase